MGNDTPRPERAPGLLDELTGRILDSSPYRFTLAVEPDDRSTAYRIRALASFSAGWARPGDFPDGMERDEFDDVAVHVLGWDGPVAVCTGRLVFRPVRSRRRCLAAWWWDRPAAT